MTNVFVSYSRHDKVRVEALVRFIDSLIGEVWWDDRFVAGESFTEETERRLNEADFVVVVWSPNSAHSKWVLDEAAVGRDAGKLIPVSLDGTPPPLGFRHVHTLDFSGWNGADTDKCAQALKAALLRGASQREGEPLSRRREGVIESGQASSPPANRSRAGKEGLRSRRRLLILAAIGAAVVISAAALSVMQPAAPDESSIAKVTADLIAGRASDDRAAAAAERAVAEIGASRRAEERAAISSFAAGDQTRALDILEKLAADLERAGDKRAAAEVYGRIGAIGSLVDQGRGIAARRKAFDLEPESLPGFQGYYFDIYRLRGHRSASAFARELIADPSTSDRMRGFAYAHLSVSGLAQSAELDVAEENLERVKALSERTGDPVLAASVHWATSVYAWRQDRLADAEKATAELGRLEEALVEPLFAAGPEVSLVRIRFAEGDWNEAFEHASRNLDARRRSGQFIPSPQLEIACTAGLYIDRVEAAAPYCDALTRRTDPNAGSRLRLFGAQLAVARGDLDKARSELDVSRALNADDPFIEADRTLIESAITAKSGDLDAAQSSLWRYLDLISGDPAVKSRRATALRLFGIWAMEREAPERACAPLKESGELYAAIGGAAGAEAANALRAKAKCA